MDAEACLLSTVLRAPLSRHLRLRAFRTSKWRVDIAVFSRRCANYLHRLREHSHTCAMHAGQQPLECLLLCHADVRRDGERAAHVNGKRGCKGIHSASHAHSYPYTVTPTQPRTDYPLQEFLILFGGMFSPCSCRVVGTMLFCRMLLCKVIMSAVGSPFSDWHTPSGGTGRFSRILCVPWLQNSIRQMAAWRKHNNEAHVARACTPAC